MKVVTTQFLAVMGLEATRVPIPTKGAMYLLADKGHFVET